jgi:apolipoprotein N-acyltransferase
VRASRPGAALVAGAVFACAAPPTNWYPALWLGMAGLAYLVDEAQGFPLVRARRFILIGVAFGTGANLVAFRFVPTVIRTFTDLPWVAALLALLLLAMEQGIRWGAAAWIHGVLARRGVPSAWAFATGVFAGTFVPAVFPWSAAGGVTPVPAMIQLADTIGERGVTFVMALSAGLLASAVAAVLAKSRRAALLRLAGAAAIPLVTFVEGRARMLGVESTRRQASTAKIALVQPSTDPHDRWDPTRAPLILARLTQATLRAEHGGAELTVWPEAAYPYPVGHLTRRCPVGSYALLPFGVRGPILAGFVMTGAHGDMTNSAAICLTDGALTKPQDKVHLLWFGETIPWLDRLPWVRARVTRGVGLVAGEEIVLQRAGKVRASVLNCFEDTLPDAGREAMGPRPNLLVNMTNDAWFAGSAESELHLRLAALRAVESRRDLVRAVNEGVTSWVDAAGVVRARLEGGGSPDVLFADAALLETDATLFDRFGDVPLAALLAASIAGAWWRARRRQLS